MGLKTEPLRVAQSGSTVDGRQIKPDWLLQAAKNYDKEKFTAVIWPDHDRYYNLGLVDSLTAEKNSEGGVDLFAVLEPNEYYRINVSNGQRLFTSVEILENFAKTGEAYLVGLGATDQPASLGTQPVKFNQQSGLNVSSFIEAQVKDIEPPSHWFHKFFKSEQDIDMTKEELAQLFAAQTQSLATALSTAITETFKSQNPAEPEKPATVPADNEPLTTVKALELFKQLTDNNGELPPDPNAPLTLATFKQLTADLFKNKGGKDDKGAGDKQQYSAEELTSLQAQIADLTAKFKKATEEVEGTDGGEDKGGGDTSLKDCI